MRYRRFVVDFLFSFDRGGLLALGFAWFPAACATVGYIAHKTRACACSRKPSKPKRQQPTSVNENKKYIAHKTRACACSRKPGKPKRQQPTSVKEKI